MDPITLVYYAVVCAGLAGFASAVEQRTLMTALGAFVGAVSAAILPTLRAAIGY